MFRLSNNYVASDGNSSIQNASMFDCLLIQHKKVNGLLKCDRVLACEDYP